MIGCTKLLCGTATVSDVLKHRKNVAKTPAKMLQFSEVNRPLVVWNVTNRCNLRCQHCYIDAEDRRYREELSTDEAKEFITDLAEMEVPVLLLSGGEPLIRSDIFELSKFAHDRGLRVVLSTNGTLINSDIARAIKESGMQYAGVSLDGMREIHDRFRCLPGAFDAALEGIRHCMKLGIKTGVRFTINKFNKNDLPEILKMVEEEGIPRFCMYHLVYSGRGKEIMSTDLNLEEKRETIELLMQKTVELHEKGVQTELLTVDNHADGVYIFNHLLKHQPERADEVMQLLKMHGGCSAGTKFANVDPLGNVHPCQFWQHVSLGNVRERKFSEIWRSDDNELLVKLRNKQNFIKGRCGECQFKYVCAGCRIRAEVVKDDVWAEDPACYLTDDDMEIPRENWKELP